VCSVIGSWTACAAAATPDERSVWEFMRVLFEEGAQQRVQVCCVRAVRDHLRC
jgi:hypothetical protein